MPIETTLLHRRAAGVLVRLKSIDPAVLATIAASFDTQPGSRGALLSASTATKRSAEEVAPQMRIFRHLGIAYGAVTLDGLNQLNKNPSVEAVVESNALRMIRPVPYLAADLTEAPGSGATWGIRKLNIDKLWAQGLTGAGVLVGHLDTGIDGAHPILEGAIESASVFDYAGREQTAKKPPTDSAEHGTHTAGTIAGREFKKVQVGVAPKARLLTAEVIEGGDSIARVLGGMDWVLKNNGRILNLSLGWQGYVDSFLMIIEVLRQKGCLPVIACGNEGEGSTRSPGNYKDALSVGAATESGRIPDFSGSEMMVDLGGYSVPDIVAPGDGIWSAAAGGGFKKMRGTSMATPHIAGLAALLLEAYPHATVAQLEHSIRGSAALAKNMSPERAGQGMPDGMLALNLLSKQVQGPV